MTIEQFKKLEKICKDAWEELAITGSNRKPARLSRFVSECPACEISRSVHNRIVHDCLFCPIDEWRGCASEDCGSVCEQKSYYGQWRQGAVPERRLAASKIASLSWSYLPEYEDIDVSDLL